MRSFYTKLFMLTCIFGLPCMASLEQQVENGRRFIQGHHEERRTALINNFKDPAIADHTKAIDDLLVSVWRSTFYSVLKKGVTFS